MSQPCNLLRRPVALLATLLLSAGAVGCNPTAEEPEPPPGLTGLSVALRFDSQSDTAAIRYRVLRKSCSGEAFTPLDRSVDKPLEDILLPGGIPGFEDQPLDGNSSHAFADLFLDLPPGCYDITTQPLRRDGSVSQDCAPASASNVRVNEGRTTELFLINQCRGDGRGAIDVISALNHPPALTSVAFERSKFVQRCEEQVVCATAKDPDNDPIEFTWQKVGGPPLLSGPAVVRTTTNPDGSTTQCVRAVAEQTGQYQLTVAVYDLLHDPQNAGRLIRFEEYFARHGSTQRSRVELTFPFYAAANGFTGSCIAPSCKVLLERAPATPSGLYTIDPDGSGAGALFEVYCEMTKDGGGWTLVMTSSDDGQDTWTWAWRTLMTTDTTLVGNVRERHKDFKSFAHHALLFRDLLFIHAPSGVWAEYGGVGNGTRSIAEFMAGISAPVCSLALAGNGHPLTAGTLPQGGYLCDTDLYFHQGDFDGTGSEAYCRRTDGSQDSTYGPGWNIGNNDGCPFDDPSSASFGPDRYPTVVTREFGNAGFGWALGLNSGATGQAQNYIQMFVR